MSGSFEICQEEATISFEDFWTRYFEPEVPVVIRGAGAEWPALTTWNEKRVKEILSSEKSANALSFWVRIKRGALSSDYETPKWLDKTLDHQMVFPRKHHMRLWMHHDNHITDWHYDENMVSVFNAQVCGTKEWLIISPDTPLKCYPFTNFAILDTDDKLLKSVNYSRFHLSPGDLLFLPPLWFHKVIAHHEPNISLNWLCTKTSTSVYTKALEREVERYALQEALEKRPLLSGYWAIDLLHKLTPLQLKVEWRCPEMIKTPTPPKKVLRLVKRHLTEISALGSAVLSIHRIYKYVKSTKVPNYF